MPHATIFYDAAGNHVAIEGDRAINPISLQNDDLLQNVF